jgi:hypothetical protein
MSRKKPVPDLIVSTFTRVHSPSQTGVNALIDALWMDTGFPTRTCAEPNEGLARAARTPPARSECMLVRGAPQVIGQSRIVHAPGHDHATDAQGSER